MAAWLDSACQDVRFAIRQLRKAPAFMALLPRRTLLLGIGAQQRNLHADRRRPDEDAAGARSGRSGHVGGREESGVGTRPQGSFGADSHELYKHLQDSNVLEGLCAFQSADAEVSVRRTGSSAPGSAGARLVSGNYFDVPGTRAAVGRTLAPFDDSPSAPPVTVVSFRFWKDRLNGDPSTVGSTIDLNGVPVAIVGVAAPGFYGDRLQPDPPGFWLPISADRQLAPQRGVVDDPELLAVSDGAAAARHVP